MKEQLIVNRSWIVPFLLSAGVLGVSEVQETGMEGYEQIIERGRIASIDEPVFVAASEGNWVHAPSGGRFDEESRSFGTGPEGVEPLPGFDTCWYTWSPFHPDTRVLR